MSAGSDRPKPNRRNPRQDHRSRSHDSAHAVGEVAPPHNIPNHPLISREPAILIERAPDLAELIARLRAAGSFAYDSEFIGELSFYPQFCLIQVATPDQVSLIDTLAGLDLREFWKLIADPTVEKIVHAGEQDLEPVFRLIGQAPANVIDVQIAAGFAGLAYPAGLSKLVRELIGVQLGKGFTFTHWDQRPLSAVQLRYAADDVRYLPALRQMIGQRLDELRHGAWAAEECAALCDPARYRSDPAADCMRIRGASALAPGALSVLRELYSWRQGAAQRHDTPPRSFLRDEILIDLARKPVASVDMLKRVRGLPRPVEEEEGASMVEACQRGLSVSESQRAAPRPVEELPTERFAADACWATVQAYCHGHSIDPALVASRQEIIRWLRELRQGGPSAPDGSLASGWRKEFLGDMLDAFVRGTDRICLTWQDGGLRSSVEAGAK